MIILLDSGVTHNFISRKLVDELKLPKLPTQFVVTLGGKKRARGTSQCDDVELHFQGISMIQKFFPFELGRHFQGISMIQNVILSVDWLRN